MQLPRGASIAKPLENRAEDVSCGSSFVDSGPHQKSMETAKRLVKKHERIASLEIHILVLFRFTTRVRDRSLVGFANLLCIFP